MAFLRAAPDACEWAWLWQVKLHEFVALLYAMGFVPLGATTLISKLTMRSPEMFGDIAPMPWDVWQVEHENPSLM